jgi:membrane fusion protein (multidrug efflux system)
MTAATVTALAPAAAPAPASEGAVRSRRPLTRKAVIPVSAALLVAAAGAGIILAPRNTVSTEAAYVAADSTVAAPKVRGLVARVLVAENQPVKVGDPLVQLDPEEFDAKVVSAQADLANAEAAVAAARAALEALGADQRLASTNVRAAQVVIASADAENARAQADKRRYDELAASGAVARRDAETRRAAAVAAQAEADKVRAQFASSQDQAAVVGARRGMLAAAVSQAEAEVARARAALDLARQDLANALVRSQVAGVVANRQVQPGDYVQPGSRLLTIVPTGRLYVTAYFKETQTARMVVGQAARLHVDALPGAVLHGRVESLSPGSGSQFSLLPFEPGTGNFTKIVQRVPVRIRLDPGPELAKLRAGLSTKVQVDLRPAEG